MPNYQPIIPHPRPFLHAALGATGATAIWGVALVALSAHWHTPVAVKSDRLDWDHYPRPPHIEPIAVQAPEPAEIVNISPTPVIPTIVPREEPKPPPPPDTTPAERSLIANGCSPGGVRTNFYVRGVLHWRCRY
jgi:hypothetical protein